MLLPSGNTKGLRSPFVRTLLARQGHFESTVLEYAQSDLREQLRETEVRSRYSISTTPELLILSFQLEISVYLVVSNWFVKLISLCVSAPLASSARWRR